MEQIVKSHVGHVREVNEDYADVFVSEDGHILLAVVADGMGGHQAGDVASKMTVEMLQSSFEGVSSQAESFEWQHWLKQTIIAANRLIYEHSQKDDELHGMGTTVVACIFLEKRFVVAHVGDSRMYIYDGQQMSMLTEDHSLVQELIQSGQISEDEAVIHPQRNVITRALGTEKEIEVDVHEFDYTNYAQANKMRFLLCSDGLTGMVKEDVISRTLAQEDKLERQASQLLDLALSGGGDDNITIVLIEKDG